VAELLTELARVLSWPLFCGVAGALLIVVGVSSAADRWL
jgi:hypothetical protein